MTKVSELKPCPFCGGTVVRVSPYTEDTIRGPIVRWQVFCADCLCSGPKMNVKAVAVARWNVRKDPEVEK